MATLSYQLLDRALDGKLAQHLAERRAAGASYETIAFDLGNQVEVRVSAETLRRWHQRIESAEREATS